jgi:triacylglycerol lipase
MVCSVSPCWVLFVDSGHPKLPFLQLRYWRGIQDALQQHGCEVGTASVGSVASLKERAEQLHLYLSTHFAGREVNLIGHSMV